MPDEFQFIAGLKRKFDLNRIGDDCAVLPFSADSDLIVTADMLVENVDFRFEWASPESLGHKALAVSLSDIAAMGGEPLWALISIAVPKERWDDGSLDLFYDGWHRLALSFGVELVGGDVSRTEGQFVVDSVVGGQVPRGKAILRSGARPGDSIYVTGSLGGAAGGLRLLEEGDNSRPGSTALLRRQLNPQPQVNIAKYLQSEHDITSMIDVSDGLSSDLRHICTASNVGAKIEAELLPVDVGLAEYFGIEESMQMALNGGEDFELLFTSRKNNISSVESGTITRIGEVTSNVGIIEFIRQGKNCILDPGGYRHF